MLNLTIEDDMKPLFLCIYPSYVDLSNYDGIQTENENEFFSKYIIYFRSNYGAGYYTNIGPKLDATDGGGGRYVDTFTHEDYTLTISTQQTLDGKNPSSKQEIPTYAKLTTSYSTMYGATFYFAKDGRVIGQNSSQFTTLYTP